MMNARKASEAARCCLPLLATALLLMAGPAAAAPPNYRYLEIGYGAANFDIGVSGLGSVKADQDGYGVDASFSFFDDRVWIFGSYIDASGDVEGVDLDTERIGLGLGGIFPAGGSATIDVALIYRQDKLAAVGITDDIDGLGAAVGIRGNVLRVLELFGRVGYLDGDYEGAGLWEAGAVWNITDLFGISAGYERLIVDDAGINATLDQYQVGARIKF